MVISIVDGLSVVKEELIKFIYDMDEEFPIPISQNVDIVTYTKKLLNNGKILCIKNKNEIIGIIGGYCNDVINKKAVVTIFVLNPEYRGKKLGNMLLEAFIEVCKKEKMSMLEIFTYECNSGARNLYDKKQFILKSINNEGNCHYVKLL